MEHYTDGADLKRVMHRYLVLQIAGRWRRTVAPVAFTMMCRSKMHLHHFLSQFLETQPVFDGLRNLL